MSEYWSTTSGTALVFPKEEVRDFFHEISFGDIQEGWCNR